jgi:hypothetical protein
VFEERLKAEDIEGEVVGLGAVLKLDVVVVVAGAGDEKSKRSAERLEEAG